MKVKNFILIGIIIVVVATGYFIFQDKQKLQPISNQQPKSTARLEQKQELKLCEKHKSGPELSPGDLYCGGAMCLSACDENGENCHKITDKEECEKLDVITIDDDQIIVMGNDGDFDCEWDPSYDGCKPNK